MEAQARLLCFLQGYGGGEWSPSLRGCACWLICVEEMKRRGGRGDGVCVGGMEMGVAMARERSDALESWRGRMKQLKEKTRLSTYLRLPAQNRLPFNALLPLLHKS